MEQKKSGRPPSEDSMTDRIFVRVDKDIKTKLDECTEVLNSTRSDIVRKGISMVHENLKN